LKARIEQPAPFNRRRKIREAPALSPQLSESTFEFAIDSDEEKTSFQSGSFQRYVPGPPPPVPTTNVVDNPFSPSSYQIFSPANMPVSPIISSHQLPRKKARRQKIIRPEEPSPIDFSHEFPHAREEVYSPQETHEFPSRKQHNFPQTTLEYSPPQSYEFPQRKKHKFVPHNNPEYPPRKKHKLNMAKVAKKKTEGLQ